MISIIQKSAYAICNDQNLTRVHLDLTAVRMCDKIAHHYAILFTRPLISDGTRDHADARVSFYDYGRLRL